MIYITFLKTNKGYSNIENLEVKKIGTEKECRQLIANYNDWAIDIQDEDSYLELFEGSLIDRGFEKCSKHWQLLWLKHNYRYSYEGAGFYDTESKQYQGANSYTNDVKCYYIETLDELDELELGAFLNDNLAILSVDEDFLNKYGVKDEEGVFEIESKIFDTKHSGYHLYRNKYYYKGELTSSYPELNENA